MKAQTSLNSMPKDVIRALTVGVDSIQSCNSKPENSNEEDDDTVPTVKSKTVLSVQIVLSAGTA